MFLKRRKSVQSGSLKLRLSLFFSIALALIVIPFSLFFFYQFNMAVNKNFDASLYNYSSEVAESLNLSVFGKLKLSPKEIFAERKVLPFSFRYSYLQIIDEEGRWLYGMGPRLNFKLPIHDKVLLTTLTQKAHLQTIKINQQNFRMINYPIIKKNLPTKLVLQIAVPVDSLEKQKNKILRFLSFTIPILLLLTFITGYLFSDFVLAPLNNIIKKTKNMKASDLNQRLPIISDEENELNQLSLTLNDLFDRLHQSFQSQEEFIANASHQLKTPLAIMKGQLDVFSSQERSADELKSLTFGLNNEIGKLTNLVNQLLTLASLDSGKVHLSQELTPLDDILFESTSRLTPYAKEHDIQIGVQITDEGSKALSDSKIKADENLIDTLFQSLIENAIKHSPAKSSIVITVDANKTHFILGFNNSGSLIPQEEQQNIFNRFYQIKASTKASQGVGLGLALSRDIAEVHNAKLWVESEKEAGTTFYFEIKRF